MSVRIKCPSCQAVVTVSDKSRGRQIRCSECEAVMKVPAGGIGRDDDDPPPRARQEEVSERPQRRPRAYDDWDEDDDRREERRSRRTRVEKKSPLPWILAGVGGGVLLLGVVVTLVLVLRSELLPEAAVHEAVAKNAPPLQ